LWPVAVRQIDTGTLELPLQTRKPSGLRDIELLSVPLRRLPADWRPPGFPEPCGISGSQREPVDDDTLEFEWASTWTKHVGSVVHRWLQQIAEEGVEHWNADRVAALAPALGRVLRRAGVARQQEEKAVRRAIEALCDTLADTRGRWLLEMHEQAASELPITTVDTDAATMRTNIIDRTFIGEDGLRWIIDYKTGVHEGGHIETFLRSEEERYRPQLERYRDAFLRLDDRPVRTALYFPLLQVFHVVECDDLQ